MGGGREESSQEMIIHYPPGFESFFSRATDLLLDYIEKPHFESYLQTPTWMEQQIYSNLYNLMQRGGFSPIDYYIRDVYLNRLGFPIETPSPSSVLREYFNIFKPFTFDYPFSRITTGPSTEGSTTPSSTPSPPTLGSPSFTHLLLGSLSNPQEVKQVRPLPSVRSSTPQWLDQVKNLLFGSLSNPQEVKQVRPLPSVRSSTPQWLDQVKNLFFGRLSNPQGVGQGG